MGLGNKVKYWDSGMCDKVEKRFVLNAMATVQIEWSSPEKSKTRKIRFLGAFPVLWWFSSVRPLNGGRVNKIKIVCSRKYTREATLLDKLKVENDMFVADIS